MLIEFTETRRYSEDGFDAQRGMAGEVRNVAHSTAVRLIRDGYAISLEPKKSPEEIMIEVMDSLKGVRA